MAASFYHQVSLHGHTPISSFSLFLRPFLIAQLVKICLRCWRPPFHSWAGKIHYRKDRLPTPVFLGLPGGSAGKESACNEGDLDSIPGLGRSPGEGHGNPQASLVVQTVKNLQCGRLRFNSGSERSPGEGNGNPLQYSCLENSMDRGA